MKHYIYLLTGLVFLAGLLAETHAIPAFARKYSMSCKTCHAPAPKLKDYGEEFAANGFELKDKEAPRYYQDTGDDQVSLIRDFPLAMRLEGHVTYNQDQSKQSDFYAPSVVKLLSGGALSKYMSYYFYYILEEGHTGKIEDAYLMFNNIAGLELDIYLGQFQVSDPLFKREVRLTREDYQILKFAPSASQINLTYDRGIMVNYSLPTGTDIFVELVNGTGIGVPGPAGTFDSDPFKNFIGRISQDLFEGVRIGGFTYLGAERQRFSDNGITMFGPDLTLNAGNFELNTMYLSRTDDATMSGGSVKEIKTQGAMAELIYMPNGDDSRFYGVAVFNWIESDETWQNHRSAALHFGHVSRRNIRLVAEYGYNFTHKYPSFSMGFVSAF